MTLERLLRAIAVAIAVLGIVDPAITANSGRAGDRRRDRDDGQARQTR